MGASETQQDIFIELGYMSYQNQPLDPNDTEDNLPGYHTPLGHTVEHTHRPSQAVIDDVAAVFAGAAQRRNPANPSQTISTPIKVHFDVGSLYQTSANVIKYKHADGTTTCTSATDAECLARGRRGNSGGSLRRGELSCIGRFSWRRGLEERLPPAPR